MNVSNLLRFCKQLQTCKRISSSSYKNIIVDYEGKVTLIGINRPEKRNCVNSETAEELKKAIEGFEDDKNAVAGVLYGLGGTFCAGYDLSEVSNMNLGNVDVQLHKEDGSMGPTMRYIKKPMIAAIDGYAVAGGFELALMCDLRIVEENAIMGVFCRRFGVPLIDGGTVRLQAMVGLSRALDFILTGREISAKEAFDCGLANLVVKVGSSLGTAMKMAISLVKFPQACLNADRNSTYNAAFSGAYLDLLRHERKNGLPIILPESVQGAKKFMQGIGRHGKFDQIEKLEPDLENQTENSPKGRM